ncbi:DNA-directed RNA polymerase subunit D [Candidatus Parvarchaeota archaeon]|nr:DNA-directed RNA polymerase subunit D [Candidatus Parvarchaeota archaeon]
MEAQKIKSDGKVTTLLLADFKLSLVNALRRAIINGVSTLAMDDVTIYKNTSPMYDEILASRLGLIPLKTDSAIKKSKKEFLFKLKETGPKTIHASDLIPSDKDVTPVYPETLIINLKEGESVELEAKAVFGTGQEHIKFSPAHVFYHFYPVIDIKKGAIKEAEKIAALCPIDILEGSGDKLSVKKGKLQDCILCKACEDFAGSDNIKISSDAKRTVFEIETWGQLETKDILDQALECLTEELNEISKKV